MTFSFKGQFTDVQPAGAPRRLTQPGCYKVTIREIDVRDTKAGNQRAYFRLIVAEGDLKGTPNTFGINLPNSDDDFVWRYWMALLISLGADEEKLRTNPTIEGDKLVGKSGYFHFAPAPEEGGFDKHKWITEQAYKFFQATSEKSPEVGEAITATETEEPLAVSTESESSDPLAFMDI